MSDATRKWEQAGGWGAIAAGGLSLLSTVLLVTSLAERRGGGATVPPVALAAVTLLAALALALTAAGTDARLRPRRWVGWLGAAGAAAAVAMTGAAGLTLLAPPPPAWAIALFELAPVGTGVWALCASAAAWKLGAWPRWLRVAGTVFGAAAMIQPGFPPAALIALIAGLGWWFGLGAALLKGAGRSTAG